MHRSLLLPLLLSTASAKELEGTYQPTQNPCPSVEEAIQKMKVPDGYEVRNFAAEPMVVNPVAMTWDHRGRLWVVELYEYPKGAKTPNEYSKTAADENFRPVVKADANAPRDKVVVLEDTDNDGKADKRTVFAEGLNLATAVLCGYDGVFIGQAPNLFFFRDTNGDDKADEYKAVLTGFGLEDRHELLNSFTWGPDGYMYFTHGVFTHSKVRRPGEPDDKGNTLNAGVYRVRFTAKDKTPEVAFHEVYADGTSNPWGVDFDARGNAFVSACVIDHLFHMAPGGIYQRQGGAPENPYAYELLPSIVNFKHFRAAYAGIQVYQGGIYPADTHGHVFMGNIHDNAIHEESLTPVGATFKAAPVRDFLRANDGWFRPVSTQTGPDGFLWIMDWCDKYPCYQNAQANPEGVDREHGRIWRVCYTGSDEGKKFAGMSRGEKEVKLGSTDVSQLIGLVGDKNSWVSRTATAMLIQSPAGADAEAGLLHQSIHAKSQEQRIATLKALFAIGRTPSQLTRKSLALLAKDRDPVVRHLVAKTISNLPFALTDMDYGALLLDLAKDDVPLTRHAVAIAARTWNMGSSLTITSTTRSGPDNLPLLENLIVSSARGEDRSLALAIWMAIEPRLRDPKDFLVFFADLAPKTKPLSQVLTYKTARRITDTRSAENMDLLLGFLDKIKADDVLTAHALDGMLKAQEAGALKPAKADPAPLFAHWQASKDDKVRSLAGRLATLWGDESAVAELIKLAEDEKAPAEKRAEALRTLRKLKSPAARAAVLRLLEKSGGGN